MALHKDNQGLYDRIAALREQVADRLGADLISNPQLADALTKQIDDMLKSVVDLDAKTPPPPDRGLGALIGIGPEAATDIGSTRVPPGIEAYDETITSERITAVGDMYYAYQHEKIGVFRVVQKLQELFKAGSVRLSGEEGAFALYQFDRRGVLRYTKDDRFAAYKRIFGYGEGAPPPGSRSNAEFQPLFSHFVQQVTLFWRDKRISDVIRSRANDPAFGGIAGVRRAGLDLRNNMKWLSFGHLNVLRVEVMQLLEECFKILNAPDVKRLFGAENAWDVVEEVLVRYFHERLATSQRQRMAVTGREILRWLAQPHILQGTRSQFETLLLEVADQSEEWLTSAQAMGLARRTNSTRVLPWDRSSAGKSNGSPRPGNSRDRVRTAAIN
jgi:hypothetical protein